MDLQHSKQGLQSFPGLFFLFSVCDIIQDLGLWLDSQLTGPKTIPTPVLITHVELSFNELVLVPYLSLESSLTFKTKFKSPQPPIAWLRPLKVAPGFLSPQRADKFSRSHFFRQYTGSMVTGTWFIWPEVVKDWVISSAKKKKRKRNNPQERLVQGTWHLTTFQFWGHVCWDLRGKWGHEQIHISSDVETPQGYMVAGFNQSRDYPLRN